MLKCDILNAPSRKHKESLLDAVSTTCGSGWVNHSIMYRMLITDPPATAGGTDRIQVQRLP
jgi:hypothetical protein